MPAPVRGCGGVSGQTTLDAEQAGVVAGIFARRPGDFHINLQRQPDPEGDRVSITMSGKFLPFKLGAHVRTQRRHGA